MTDPQQRLDDLRRAFEDHSDQVAALRERAAAIAEQTVTGEAAQGQVVVTVTGRGDIQGVRVSQRALRETDNLTLAAQVMAATNDALDKAEALLAGLRPTASTDIDAAVDRYEHRMDALLDRLDVIDRSIQP